MDYTIKEIQNKLKDLLQVFHDFCEEKNLKYYMAYGTMLGAYRHKGFIPWDDDVDVYMPRDDYDKLLDFSRNGNLPKKIFLKYNETSEDIIFPYAMFVDKNTTLVYEKPGETKNMVEGLYIDVFPVTGASDNNFLAKLQSYNWYILNKKLSYSQEVAKRKNIILTLFNKYASLFEPQSIHRKIEKNSIKNSFYNSKNLLFAPTSGGPMKKEILGTPTLYKFEDKMFYGPEKAEKYLQHVFGDFMKLPPKEKQISHHKFGYINLDLPFEEYKEHLASK